MLARIVRHDCVGHCTKMEWDDRLIRASQARGEVASERLIRQEPSPCRGMDAVTWSQLTQQRRGIWRIMITIGIAGG